MKTETLKKITQELKADGYKLESMRFRNQKGSEVTIFIDEEETESEEINSRGTSKSMIEEWRS